MICAERFEKAAFFDRTGRGDDLCTFQLSDLQRGKTDTASGTVNEDRLARFDMAELNHGIIGCQERDRYSCGGGKIEPIREFRNPIAADTNMGRESGRADAHYAIARLQVRDG
ncbi:hypothetical protein D3C73_565820 [compost metagenome]